MTLEDELRRMGVQESKVSATAEAIRDASVCSTLSVDGILSGLKVLMSLEAPKVDKLDLNRLANYSAGLLKK
jgi:hypothetical protein